MRSQPAPTRACSILTHTLTHAVSRTSVDVSAIQQLSLPFTSDSARYIVRLPLPEGYREVERVIPAQRILQAHLERRFAHNSGGCAILVPDPARSRPYELAAANLLAGAFVVVVIICVVVEYSCLCLCQGDCKLLAEARRQLGLKRLPARRPGMRITLLQ